MPNGKRNCSRRRCLPRVGGGGGSAIVTRTTLRNELRGLKLIPKVDPPAVSVRPWISQRLVFFGKGSKGISDKTVVAGIQTQFKITVTDPALISFRVQEARVWLEITPSNPLSAPLTVYFHSIFGENFISQQADFGGEVRYARCGYRWPVNDQNATLDTSGVDYRLIDVLPVDTSQNWIIHFDVLWTVVDPIKALTTLDGTVASKCPCELEDSTNFSII